jgi:hypothetical protein
MNPWEEGYAQVHLVCSLHSQAALGCLTAYTIRYSWAKRKLLGRELVDGMRQH